MDLFFKQMIVKYGFQKNSDFMQFFKDFLIDLFECMWVIMKFEEKMCLILDRSIGIELVKNGMNGSDFVFLDLVLMNEYVVLWYCDMELFDQNFKEIKFSMGFLNGVLYKDDINRVILILKERGQLDVFKDKLVFLFYFINYKL